MPRAVRRITNPDLIAWAHLVRLLGVDWSPGRSNIELAEATGLTKITVDRYCAVLHQAGAAHISRYDIDRNGRQTIRVFRLGRDDDAVPNIRPRHVRAKAQRHRERLSGKRGAAARKEA